MYNFYWSRPFLQETLYRRKLNKVIGQFHLMPTFTSVTIMCFAQHQSANNIARSGIYHANQNLVQNAVYRRVHKKNSS